MSKPVTSKSISVVIATYNRGLALAALLKDLTNQTLPASEFEVIVVDDGSSQPAQSLLGTLDVPYACRIERQINAGAAAARHRGIGLAQADIVVIVDDDMRLAKDFLSQHWKAHAAGATVVLGHIAPSKDLKHMPVFERFHAYQLERFVQQACNGRIPVRGVHVCTGNVSFRKADYVKLGGFDQSLGRSEDRELGIRLEKAGARLVFNPDALCVHESDHVDLGVWLRRAFHYGVCDRRIAQKHPDVEIADPWRFFYLINPVSRPWMLAAVGMPTLGSVLSRWVMRASVGSDGLGLKKAAVFGTTLGYGLEYFRGMRIEAGSLRQALEDWRSYRFKRRHMKQTEACSSGKAGGHTNVGFPENVGFVDALKRFVHAIRADYGSVQRYRAKYHAEHVSLARMPIDGVRKIGLQMNLMVRTMQLLRDVRVPAAAPIVSRLIRHLYGSDIHWNAQIAPGISIVHGMGLVISHRARVGPGCILFQNVTLGEGIDPKTRQIGAPCLGQDVHVGPGSTLLGPIEIGDGTKIMAGSVVVDSVPPGSLVRPAQVWVGFREVHTPC